MSYSIDLRKRVVQFIENGGSILEAVRIFGVTRQTIYNWFKKKKTTGSLQDKVPERPWRKLEPQALIAFIENNPDLTLAEYAKHFGTIPSTMCEAFKRLRISRKKRPYATKRGMKKRERYFWKR